MPYLRNAAKWYVYELSDPRDNCVFYVGKGSGGRMNDHERQAVNGVCSRKTRKINEIRATGLEIGKQKVCSFWDEQAAYDHETDLIEFYGLQNLTNVLPGGQKAFIRRMQERDQRKVLPVHVVLARHPASSLIYQSFAKWFAAGMHLRPSRITVRHADGSCSFNTVVTEGLYNTLIPILWKAIRADPLARDEFARKMRPHGLEFV